MALTFNAPAPDYEDVQIWTPPAGETTIQILGPWVGVWIHWVGRRTMPCLNEDCPKARHNRPIRWCGYAPIVIFRSKEQKRAVLGLSPEKAKDVEAELTGFPGPFLKCHRKAGSREWTIKDIFHREVKGTPPPAPDVQLVLLRVWGIKPEDVRGPEAEETSGNDSKSR